LIGIAANDKTPGGFAALHALWTLDGLGAFADGANQELLQKSFASSSYAVQRAAISLLPASETGSNLLAGSGLLAHENLQIRLAALLRAGELPETDALFQAVETLLTDPSTAADKWLTAAAKVYHKEQNLTEVDPAKVTMLIPAADEQKSAWKYTEEKPADNWYALDYQASGWKTGQAVFGKGNDKTATTPWTTSDIWLRREITLKEAIEEPVLKIMHDDNYEVYVNGQLVFAEAGSSREYKYIRIEADKAGLFQQGKNLIAVYCHDKGGQKYIDVGIGKIAKPRADVAFNLNTINQKMAYDKTLLRAEAGQTIEIRLNNADQMPHNLVVIQPGSLPNFGKVVDAFLKHPDAAKMNYVPNSRYVLAATDMLEPGASGTIIFELPDVPGRYPFVCTFPGHWQMMRGEILVSAPGSYLADAADAPMLATMGGSSSHDFLSFFGIADGKVLSQGGANTVLYTESVDVLHHMLKDLDVLVLTNNQALDRPTQSAIFSRVNAGMPLLIHHPSIWYNWKDWPEYNRELVGGGSRSHEKLQEFEVRVVKPDHPIMQGVPAQFRIVDELYRFEKDPEGTEIEVLAVGKGLESGEEYPVVWTVKHPKAKIACNTLGHDARAHNLPAYQSIISNSLNWVQGKVSF
jgi:uncharacterized protein